MNKKHSRAAPRCLLECFERSVYGKGDFLYIRAVIVALYTV
jgi:hypothetical protein